MSEKQFEESLNYGDSISFVGRISDLLQGTLEKVEKTFDKVLK